MTPEPLVQPLSRSQRGWIFRSLFVVFCVVMPIFVFYAVGYRIDFSDDRNIVTVGGLYISADADDVLMFVDEKPVTNMRIFQQAAYIQNVEAGLHRVHVSRDGLHTWVKVLPVYSHIVTEAAAFNMPEVPRIRFIPQWINEADLPVLISDGTLADAFPNATTTNAVIATSTRSTAAFTENSEYEFVESLFAVAPGVDTAAPRRAVDLLQETVRPTDDDLATSTATTTRVMRDVRLFESENEVYAEWVGPDRSIPYYYCITYTTPERTALEYGDHVHDSLARTYKSEDILAASSTNGTRLCRDTIRIDNEQQEITWFDFLPDSAHHVLTLRPDGLFVVEIDDRGWQNIQPLYKRAGLDMRVDGGQIYAFDGTHYFEILTEAPLITE